MTNTAIATIAFAGAELLALRGATPERSLVAMRPVVEAMGLDWATQHRKIGGHPVLGPCMVNMPMQVSGQTRDMACLPLSRVNFWLATIHTNRLAPVLREKVLQYQRECADVLFRHFVAPDTQTSALDARQQGGIVKGVVHKALADHLVPVHAGMDELRAENRAITEKIGQLILVLGGQVTNPTAAPAQEYISALGYLESKGWPQPGRRGMVVAVSARLERFSAREGYPVRFSTERGTRLYHVDAVAAWEGAEGRAFLAACRDRTAGQGRLNIDRGRRRGGAR